MPDFGFDGPTQRLIEPAGAGLFAEFIFNRDMFSAWKRWAVLNDGENLKFGQVFTVEGGTPIGTTGRSTGVSFVQDAAWFVRPDERDHVLSLVGPGGVDSNLFSGGGRLSTLTLGTFNTEVTVTNAASAQLLETGVSGLTAQESANQAQNTADLSAMAASVAQISIDLGAINTSVATIDGNIATIQTSVGAININIGAMQGDLSFVHLMEHGRWRLEADDQDPDFGVMTFYNAVGGVLKQFEMLNAQGQRVAVNATERNPLP